MITPRFAFAFWRQVFQAQISQQWLESPREKFQTTKNIMFLFCKIFFKVTLKWSSLNLRLEMKVGEIDTWTGGCGAAFFLRLLPRVDVVVVADVVAVVGSTDLFLGERCFSGLTVLRGSFSIGFGGSTSISLISSTLKLQWFHDVQN